MGGWHGPNVCHGQTHALMVVLVVIHAALNQTSEERGVRVTGKPEIDNHLTPRLPVTARLAKFDSPPDR